MKEENDERRFGYIYICSCGPKSWYKDLVGYEVLACLVGYDLDDGTFLIKHFYDFKIIGDSIRFHKPFSIIDIILL